MKYRPSSDLPVTYCWMLASSFFTSPIPAALPANWLYFSAKPTFSVAWVTTGRNLTASGERVFSAKKPVTAVAPPDRMFFASITLMDFTAPTSKSFARGTAASAARFMAVTSSSTRVPWPRVFNSLAASARNPGKGIRTLSFPRNPSVLPSKPMAAKAPFSSAALRPWEASALVRSPSESAKACWWVRATSVVSAETETELNCLRSMNLPFI